MWDSPESMANILSWDLECSSLNADFGLILTMGYKTVGKGKPVVLNILDYRDKTGDLIKAEKKLLQAISEVLLDSDCWLTHFGTWYDIPFVNSRLIYHNLPILPPTHPHVDTWKISKKHLKLRNNRLITISEFLGTEDEKDAIRPEAWIRALGGNKEAMGVIVEHNRRDVLVLEEVYNRIKPLLGDHPSVAIMDGREGCKNCGENRLQKRGFHVTASRKYQRYQCQSCGAWSRDTKAMKG